MGDTATTGKGSAQSGKANGSSGNFGGKRGVRKPRSYEMNDNDRLDLQSIRQAKAACTRMADMLQDGKQVPASAISAAMDLVKAFASMRQ